MKKTISIFLVFCIGLSIAGFYPVFVTLQYKTRQEIKMRIKQGIPQGEIHKITFALNEKVNWVRKGKEFRFRNQMYDIVKEEYLQKQVIYYCISDKVEEELFSNLDELVKKQMEDRNSAGGNIVRLLLDIFSLTYIAVEPGIISGFYISTKASFRYVFAVTPVILETEIHPPDLG